MSSVDAIDVKHTVEFWRRKASDIEERYAKQSPVMVNHIVAGITACAEDIEAHIREAEARACREARRAKP
jgi:hypothetical protein